MRMTTGQVPLQPLLVTVLAAGKPVDLNQYTNVTFVLEGPEAENIDMTGGIVQVTEEGKARYLWPPTTLFATPGEYRLQLRAEGGSSVDYTLAGSIRVLPALGE